MITIITTLAIIVSLLYTLKFLLKSRKSYWIKRKVPFIPFDYIFGNVKDVVLTKDNPAEALQKLYNHENAKNEPIVGMYIFLTPALIIRDPELIKMILVKDFNLFANRSSTVNPHPDSLGAFNMFFAKYGVWKDVRSNITPVFTSGKMKQMFSLVNKIGHQMDAYFSSLPVDPKTNSTNVELKELCAQYTTDVIASVAYGIEANSMKNPNGEFRRNGRKIFKFTLFRAIQFNFIFFLPKLASMFGIRFFSAETTDFIKSTIKYAMSEREKSGIKRNDLIDTLLSLKQTEKFKTKKNEKDYEDILIAQAAVFFSAGFETSSSVMSFTLYELSKHIDMQNRIRDEIKNVLIENNGDITYESVLNMEYLNMVLQEVLRLYPPLPFLDRTCQLPKDVEGYSLEPISNFAIPNDMPVFIPIYGIQRDPKYFPNPEKFDPERFSPENKDNIIPYTYLPFGVGPRVCIGERLGLMQARIGLISFFKNHYVRLSSKSHKTMVLDEKALIIQSKDGIFVDIVRDPLM